MENTSRGPCPSTQDPRSTVKHYSLILARAGNLARAGKFFRAGRTFRVSRTFRATPFGLREPPSCPLSLRETPYTTPSGTPPPLLYPSTRPLNYPERAGIPNYQEGVITPSQVVRRHQHLPLGHQPRSPERFYTLLTVYLRLRRTLPDSADLPPGLYSNTMGPSYKIHSLPGQSNYPTLAYLPYRYLYTPMCQFRTIDT